jgi:outer membrane lipopolysaccharide assembly protein LptE/RlpB
MNLVPSARQRRHSLGLLLLLIALQLGGCGFQPRGAAMSHLNGVPTPLFIAGVARYSDLYRELDRQLTAADVELTTDPAASASTLVISRWDRDSRVLSVDSRNKAVEYELDEVVSFALRSGSGEELLAPQNERVMRIQYRPPDSLLGATRESEVLGGDMRRELVERIVRRLATLN